MPPTSTMPTTGTLLDLPPVADDAAAPRVIALRSAAAREAWYAEARRAPHHTLMLRLAVAILLCTFLLEVRPDQRVAVRGFTDYPLPETCASKMLWGLECPGCGLTRSFIWTGRGQWLKALEVNRAGFLVMIAVVAQIPYRLIMLRHLCHGRTRDTRLARYFGWSLIGVLFVNWALKLLGI